VEELYTSSSAGEIVMISGVLFKFTSKAKEKIT
jgi:hypothetical protein